MITHTKVWAVTYRERTRLADGTPTEMHCAECDAVWPIHRWYRWPWRVTLVRRRAPFGRWGVQQGNNQHAQKLAQQVWAWWHFRLLIGPSRYQGGPPDLPWTCPQCGARWVTAQRYVELLAAQARGPVEATP